MATVSFYVVLTLLAAGQAPAASRPDSGATTDAALVREVRALREAVEQFLAANVRAQLLMGRLQVQEARVQSLVRQTSELDAQVASLGQQRDAVARDAKVMERLSKESPDAHEREAAADQGAALIERLKQFDARFATLTAEQAAVQQLLVAEQNRWGEFNLRLEELERLLTPVRR